MTGLNWVRFVHRPWTHKLRQNWTLPRKLRNRLQRCSFSEWCWNSLGNSYTSLQQRLKKVKRCNWTKHDWTFHCQKKERLRLDSGIFVSSNWIILLMYSALTRWPLVLRKHSRAAEIALRGLPTGSRHWAAHREGGEGCWPQSINRLIEYRSIIGSFQQNPMHKPLWNCRVYFRLSR